MSNRRRKRTGQAKIAANLKVRLDRGAAKLAARSKRREAREPPLVSVHVFDDGTDDCTYTIAYSQSAAARIAGKRCNFLSARSRIATYGLVIGASVRGCCTTKPCASMFAVAS